MWSNEMTIETKREAAIRMLSEAGIENPHPDLLPSIERFVAIAQAEQREKDAVLCSEDESGRDSGGYFADLIRNQGEQE